MAAMFGNGGSNAENADAQGVLRDEEFFFRELAAYRFVRVKYLIFNVLNR